MTEYLDISLAITYGSLYLAIISVIFHNWVSSLLGREEALFFSLAGISILVFPFAFVASSIIWFISTRRKKKAQSQELNTFRGSSSLPPKVLDKGQESPQ